MGSAPPFATIFNTALDVRKEISHSLLARTNLSLGFHTTKDLENNTYFSMKFSKKMFGFEFLDLGILLFFMVR